MQTKSNKIGNVSWQVHTETGMDVIRKRQLLARVYDPTEGQDSAEFNAWFEFIEAFVQSTDVVTPFSWCAYTSDIIKLKPIRDCWLDLPGTVFRAWKDDLSEVNTPLGSDVDLLPIESLSEEKKETLLQSPSEQTSAAS